MTHDLRPATARPHLLTRQRVLVTALAGSIAVCFAFAMRRPAPIYVQVVLPESEPSLEAFCPAPTCSIAEAPPAPAPEPETEIEPEIEPETEVPLRRPRPRPTVYLPCRWNERGCDEASDDGFPAISSDGREFAVALYEDDGGRGYPNLKVRRIDTASGRIIKSYTLVAADEIDALAPNDDSVLAIGEALVAKRSGAVQAALDARGFTALTPLSGEVTDGLSARTSGAIFQVNDAATGWTHYQEAFGAQAEFGSGAEEDECHPQGVYAIEGWLDAARGALLVSVTFRAGPCFCSDVDVHYARTIGLPGQRSP